MNENRLECEDDQICKTKLKDETACCYYISVRDKSQNPEVVEQNML